MLSCTARDPQGREGHHVVFSGNRDETVIPNADEFIVDRKIHGAISHLGLYSPPHGQQACRNAATRALGGNFARELSIEVIAPPKRTTAVGDLPKW